MGHCTEESAPKRKDYFFLLYDIGSCEVVLGRQETDMLAHGLAQERLEEVDGNGERHAIWPAKRQ